MGGSFSHLKNEMSLSLRFLAVCLSISAVVPVSGQDSMPAIDGVFDEWDDEHIVARERVRDSTEAFDIKTVSAAEPVTLQNGLPNNGTIAGCRKGCR